MGGEVVLEVGAEMGSITLYGWRHGDGWRYAISTVDHQTPMLLDEEVDNAEVRPSSAKVNTWEAALHLMDRYPWHKPSPYWFIWNFESGCG